MQEGKGQTLSGFVKMTDEEYRKVDAINASGLITLLKKTPFHYAYEKAFPKKETDSTRFGTFVHRVVLENEIHKFSPIPKCDRRTKEGKAIYESFDQECTAKGLTAVDAEDFESLFQINKETKDNKIFKSLCDHPESMKEVAVFATNKDGFLMKGKIDLVVKNKDEVILCDLKTSDSISEIDFSRSIYNYGYNIQMAMYDMLLDMNGVKPHRHLIFAVENKQPHCFRVFELERSAIEAGAVQLKQAIQTYIECKKSGTWPAYSSNEITQIGLPAFANTF